MARTALILSGGAPNATLMSGALVAFIERKLNFDVVSAAGAGALIGLLYLAPKDATAKEALQRSVEMGIADPIYRRFPVNYKVFNKPGVAADAFRTLTAPWFEQLKAFTDATGDPRGKLFSDWLGLLGASACPSNLDADSLGLCAHPPFLDHLIDFSRLPALREAFYINAWNISRGKMAIWGKDVISDQHCKAALAFPFLYPPYALDGDLYYEGAIRDCLNYQALLEAEPDVKTIVIFDVLGLDTLIRPPRDLYDAWVQSIIAPLVAVAKDDTAIFELKYNQGPNKRRLLKVEFKIDEDRLPNVLDWSRSNLEYLFEVGHRAGHAFCDQHAVLLGAGVKPARRARAAA